MATSSSHIPPLPTSTEDNEPRANYDDLKAWIAAQEAYEATTGQPAPLTPAQRKAISQFKLPPPPEPEIGGTNWIGILLEFRDSHPNLNMTVTFTESVVNSLSSSRYCCTCVLGGSAFFGWPTFPPAISATLRLHQPDNPVVPGPSDLPSFVRKKDAKQYAARCTVERLVSVELLNPGRVSCGLSNINSWTRPTQNALSLGIPPSSIPPAPVAAMSAVAERPKQKNPPSPMLSPLPNKRPGKDCTSAPVVFTGSPPHEPSTDLDTSTTTASYPSTTSDVTTLDLATIPTSATSTTNTNTIITSFTFSTSSSSQSPNPNLNSVPTPTSTPAFTSSSPTPAPINSLSGLLPQPPPPTTHPNPLSIDDYIAATGDSNDDAALWDSHSGVAIPTTKRVCDLCAALDLPAPRYHITPADDDGLFSGWAEWSAKWARLLRVWRLVRSDAEGGAPVTREEGGYDPPTCRVENIISRKLVKQAVADQALKYVKMVYEERQAMARIKRGQGDA